MPQNFHASLTKGFHLILGFPHVSCLEMYEIDYFVV